MDTPTPPRDVNPDIPPRLAFLIERLMAKDREQRPATAKAVADELAAVEREAAQPAPEDRTLEQASGRRQPAVAASRSPRKPSSRRWLAAASLLLLLGGLAAAIVVIVRDRQGKEVARVTVPEGGSFEGKDDVKPPPVAPKEGVPLGGAPLMPRPGEPLSPTALVQRPAKLPGVRAWSIELRNQQGPNAVAYRPDGKRLAVGYWDGSIRVWEPDSGRLVQVLLGARPIRTLAWSPDGRVLAAGASPERQPVRLWDPESGRLLRALETSLDGIVRALAWSADGQSIRSWIEGAGSVTWNAADGKPLGTFAPPAAVAGYSPDAKWLAAVQREDGRTALWDAAKGKKVRELATPRWNGPWTVAWSPDGKRLAFGEANGIHVWDVESDKEVFTREGMNDWSLAWSPDGRMLAYGVPPHYGAMVEVKEGSKLLGLEIRASIHAWSPDGKTLASVPYSMRYGWVRLYDAATGKRRQSLSEAGGLYNPAWPWSLDGTTVAVCENGQTTLASVDTGQVRAVLEDSKFPVALSPDGGRAVTGGPNHTLTLWEQGGKVRIPLAGHEQDPTGVAWSPDGKRLASMANGEKRVLLWNADKGERLREVGPYDVVPGHGERWSPDGRLFAFYAHPLDVGFHFWDVEQNKLVNDPTQWKSEALQAITPDGRAAWANGLPLQDVTTGKKLPGEVPSVGMRMHTAWSPDGRLFAAQSPSGLELWRGDLRRRVRALEGLHYPESHSWRVAFSSDGKLVLGMEDSRRLHVWETDTGRLHGILLLGEPWNNLAIAPEGHYNGNDKVGRAIVVVVQKEDGSQELLEPADFEAKYGWRNDPNKVHLLQPLPPQRPLYPPPGGPMGPGALVREPAPLRDPDATSWTIETLNPRGRVGAVAYRPDGKLVATGSTDGTIRIWDTASGELVRMLVGGPVAALSWSADGKLLLAACVNDGAWLWEADAGRLLRRFPAERWPASLSPDGRTLAVRADTLELVDAATGKVVRTHRFPQAPASVDPPVWSPDGKTIALTLGKRVGLWDVASAKEGPALEGHEGPVLGLAWSADSKQLATLVREERALRVWDAGGKMQKRFEIGDVYSVAWSPDGKSVALGFGPGPNGLYDVETGKVLREFDAGLVVSALAMSPDGKQVATAGPDGVRLHHAVTGKRTHTLETLDLARPIASLAWSPDSRSLALGYSPGRDGLRLEAATGRRQAPLPVAGWRAAAWSADGKTFATVDQDGSVQLWDAATSRLTQTLEDRVETGGSVLAWSPAGKKVAAGGLGHLRVWSVETGKVLWQKPDLPGNVTNLAWSPDGRRLGTIDEAVRLWDAETGKLLHESPLARWETQAAWSPDGKVLAAGPTEQGECLLIDAASEAVRVKARDEALYHFHAIRWSADGKTLGILDRGDFLRVFDAATGKLLHRTPLSLPHARANWSPDGRVLARRTIFEVHLYDSSIGPLGVLLPDDSFGQLAVSPEGYYRGSAPVERAIRMVVQKRDGTTETLAPREFAQKYGFPNDPEKVRLTD